MEVSKVSRWWSQKSRGNSLNRSQGSGLKSQGGGLKSLIAVSIVPGGGLNSLRVVVSVVAGAVYIVPVVSQ